MRVMVIVKATKESEAELKPGPWMPANNTVGGPVPVALSGTSVRAADRVQAGAGPRGGEEPGRAPRGNRVRAEPGPRTRQRTTAHSAQELSGGCCPSFHAATPSRTHKKAPTPMWT